MPYSLTMYGATLWVIAALVLTVLSLLITPVAIVYLVPMAIIGPVIVLVCLFATKTIKARRRRPAV